MDEELMLVLSQTYKENLQKRISVSLERNGQCLLWRKSTGSAGYPQIKVTAQGWGSRPVAIHRLVYLLHYGYKQMTGLHVSHLCHNKLCCEPEHLTLEPGAVNSQRILCKSEGQCHGHSNYPGCLLY